MYIVKTIVKAYHIHLHRHKYYYYDPTIGYIAYDGKTLNKILHERKDIANYNGCLTINIAPPFTNDHKNLIYKNHKLYDIIKKQYIEPNPKYHIYPHKSLNICPNKNMRAKNFDANNIHELLHFITGSLYLKDIPKFYIFKVLDKNIKWAIIQELLMIHYIQYFYQKKHIRYNTRILIATKYHSDINIPQIILVLDPLGYDKLELC